MPRYIDADKVMEEINRIGGHNLCEWETIGVKALIDRQPTADVVPKSEVERLVDKWIGEENLTQDEKTLRLIEQLRDEAKRYERYYFNHEYDKLIAEAKAEVAREIFEEIEKYTELSIVGGRLVYWNTLTELKKKYTEVSTDENL